MAGTNIQKAGLLGLELNHNECRPTFSSWHCRGSSENTLQNTGRNWLQKNEISSFSRPFWQEVVRPVQEGGADGDVLIATEDQPVQLVCPKVLPRQRLIKCTLPICTYMYTYAQVCTYMQWTLNCTIYCKSASQ